MDDVLRRDHYTADGKVDDPAAAPDFPALAQRFNKRLGGARRHCWMAGLKAQCQLIRFGQCGIEHQYYAIGRCDVESDARAQDNAGCFRIRIRAMGALENIDLAGYVEIVNLDGQACLHQHIRGLGKRPGTIQNETDTSKARLDIGRRVEREQLRGKAQISGQLSDLRRVSAGQSSASQAAFQEIGL
jgi:hypothetical protein